MTCRCSHVFDLHEIEAIWTSLPDGTPSWSKTTAAVRVVVDPCTVPGCGCGFFEEAA